MKKMSKTTKNLQGQAAFRVLARAKQLERKGRNILHFEIGEPDFDTPAHIIEAERKAIDNKQTHYVQSNGIVELKEAVCREIEKTRGFLPEASQVLIAPGANPIIYFALSCLANPKDEIISPDPGFFTYNSAIRYLDQKLVSVPILEENEFRMNPSDVRERITSKTRLVIMNSPQNPTGSVMTKNEIAEMAEISEEHDLYLLSDEIYSKMTYERKHYSPAVNDECRERTILLDGFSKKYAMTGWRLGYAVGPTDVIEKMGLLLQTIVSCTPPFIQHAGVGALEGGDKCIEDMMSQFRKRRDVFINGLNKIPGISCVMPQGAFYAFPNITKTGMNSDEFTEFLLEKGGIALLSGNAFGRYGEGFVRFSYATDIEKIKEALERMRNILL